MNETLDHHIRKDHTSEVPTPCQKTNDLFLVNPFTMIFGRYLSCYVRTFTSSTE